MSWLEKQFRITTCLISSGIVSSTLVLLLANISFSFPISFDLRKGQGRIMKRIV